MNNNYKDKDDAFYKCIKCNNQYFKTKYDKDHKLY